MENTQRCQVRFNPPVTPSKVITAEKMLWKRRKCKSHYFLKHKHDEIRLTFRSAAITFPGTTEILVQTDELECWWTAVTSKTYYTRTFAVTHYRLTLSSIKHSKTHPSCCLVPAWCVYTCFDWQWHSSSFPNVIGFHSVLITFFKMGCLKPAIRTLFKEHRLCAHAALHCS